MGNMIKALEATMDAANEGRGAYGSYRKFNLIWKGRHWGHRGYREFN